jgi:CspA family cold shock protein
MIGTIKRYDPAKGFGFIQREDRQPDVFFHINNVHGGDLTVGQRVDFEVTEDRRHLGKLHAVEVYTVA